MIQLLFDSFSTEKAINDTSGTIQKYIDAAFVESGEALNETSRTNHPKWVNRFGNLQADVDFKYIKEKSLIEHGLGFNPKTLVKWRGGFFSFGGFVSYGVFHHKRDPWIYRSLDTNEGEILNIFDNALGQGIKEVMR